MNEHAFNSFLMGGFECSTHRDRSGRRLDLISSTRHDEFAEHDYSRLAELGISTCRDGLRWHLIEPEPFRYDFSSLENQVGRRIPGVQVIWDYFHYGYPDDIDIFTWIYRAFRLLLRAATEFLTSEFGHDIVVCPVNEISFFSWIAGTAGNFYPSMLARHNSKHSWINALIRSTREIRAISPPRRSRLPIRLSTSSRINDRPQPGMPPNFIAWLNSNRSICSMAVKCPEFGGTPDLFDIIGLNYYSQSMVLPESPQSRSRSSALSSLKFHSGGVHHRYHKPLVIAETVSKTTNVPTGFDMSANKLRRHALEYGFRRLPLSDRQSSRLGR